jgi:seryl-tRNA synthetase
MYDIKWIREHPDAFDRGLKRRGLEPLSGKLLALDEKRRAAITKSEQAQARRNAASKEIGHAKAKKDEAAAQKLMAEVAEIKESTGIFERDVVRAQRDLYFGNEATGGRGLANIDNLPLEEPEVPTGKDETQNRFEHDFGSKRSFAFAARQHFELGEALGMMDFESAAKLSGARFVVLQKSLARLERALGQFMLDTHTAPASKNVDGVEVGGYTEVNPPLMVRDEVMFGTAQLPKFSNDQFRVETEDDQRKHAYLNFELDRKMVLDYAGEKGIQATRDEKMEVLGFEYRPTPDRRWLIPTAEVPLTNLVRDSIVDENTLPRRYTACTPCFRAEAGAAGKDTRGMIRQHQFTKVELVSIVTPEKSKEEHERMLACAEEVLKKLELHYRVVTLCTGDMGFAAQKTYDIEVWLPGQNMYREISSCSNCGEFQARRMNARYRGKDGVRHIYTLNGSGVAVGRALIAVMENYQDENGAIAVPDALRPYMGGITKIERKE